MICFLQFTKGNLLTAPILRLLIKLMVNAGINFE